MSPALTGTYLGLAIDHKQKKEEIGSGLQFASLMIRQIVRLNIM